jgi:hypothetical protein
MTSAPRHEALYGTDSGVIESFTATLYGTARTKNIVVYYANNTSTTGPTWVAALSSGGACPGTSAFHTSPRRKVAGVIIYPISKATTPLANASEVEICRFGAVTMTKSTAGAISKTGMICLGTGKGKAAGYSTVGSGYIFALAMATAAANATNVNGFILPYRI